METPTTPSVTFSEIRFSGGTKIALGPSDIVAFVGPNNAGKSAALRDLELHFRKGKGTVVVVNVEIKNSISEEFEEHLKSKARYRVRSGNEVYEGLGFSIQAAQVKQAANAPEANLAVFKPFFLANLSTQNRLSGSDPAGQIELHEQAPTHPIHLLLEDRQLEQKVSDLFRRAFGQDLITFRAGGSRFPLYVGTNPTLEPGEDRLDKSYVDRLREQASPLQEQGDGMRSFATILLHSLLSSHQSIQLLDEPEAFLHPPQARLLGKFIAEERNSDSQLFLTTHSLAFLEGLISTSSKNLRIVRITRDGDINTAQELSRDIAIQAATDPLFSYSRVLEGIFYSHVIITESDSDSLLYRSIFDLESVSGPEERDVYFIHSSGKGRMSKIANMLRSVGVSTSCIADVDILRNRGQFKSLYESLGGHWSDIESVYSSLIDFVNSKQTSYTIHSYRKDISDVLDQYDSKALLDKNISSKVSDLSKNTSFWKDIKTAGRSAFLGKSAQDFDQLLDLCSRFGLWIVPVGEIEGFCRSKADRHGPPFVARVLEECDIGSSDELASLRDFMGEVFRQAFGLRRARH